MFVLFRFYQPVSISGLIFLFVAASAYAQSDVSLNLAEGEQLVNEPGAAMLQEQAAVPAADFESLWQWMLTHNHDLRAARGDRNAADARTRSAGAWPDPMLRIEKMNRANGSAMSDDPVSDTRYGIEQMIPLGGKRRLEKQAAVAQAEQTSARLEQTQAGLRAMLRVEYSRYFAATETIRINEEIMHLLEDMATVAQTRYANGMAAQQDVIQLKTEQLMLQSELLRLKGEHHHAIVAVNRLLARETRAALPLPKLPPVNVEQLSELEQTPRQLTDSPALQAAEAELRAARANETLAKRQWYPDLTVDLSVDEGGSLSSGGQIMFEINLPFPFEKRRAGSTEAAAMRRAAGARLDAETLHLQHEVATALQDFRVAEEQEVLFRKQLLPQTMLAFRSALAAYENGQVDFDILIEAERQIRQTRLAVLQAAVDQQRAAAQLEQLMGYRL
jgi:outer membrane protein TolC